MNRTQIQQELIQFLHSRNFNAPYGILEGSGTSKQGRPYLSITFGRPRTLDAELQIYGASFITLRHSRNQYGGTRVLRSLAEAKNILTSL